MNNPALNEATLTRECLQRLGENDSLLHQAARALERIAHSSIGLGEVLQDYAHQAWNQASEVIRVAQALSQNMQTADDREVLENIPLAMKSVKTVLDMTPPAMLRNKADAIADGTLKRTDIMALAEKYNHSGDIARLLSDDAGRALVALQDGAQQTLIAPEHSIITSRSVIS